MNDELHTNLLPHICDGFFKFYFQAIGQSHSIERVFDFSKYNHKCFSHLYFDQNRTDFECHMQTNLIFKHIRYTYRCSSPTFIYAENLFYGKLFICYIIFVCHCVFNPYVGIFNCNNWH